MRIEAARQRCEGPSLRAPLATRARNFLSGFRRSEQGDVAIMFGLLAVTMMMFVGGAVDFSRWLTARTATLHAVDAAVLAGARALQTGSSESEAVRIAQEYYDQNVVHRGGNDDTIKFKVTRDGLAIQAEGNASIKTPFLSFAGIDELPLMSISGAEYAEAVLAVGGNGGSDLEVSLMLDITGSMAGSKIADLKDAAKDLIDIIVWDDQSEFTARVALVPFSESIRVDDNWAAEVATNGPQKITFYDRRGNKYTWKVDPKCFTERTGSEKFTDANPVGQDKLGRFYDSNASCLPTSGEVIPLTSDKETLKSKIDGYQASGNTAGHLGTAWAWYMLSPNWAQRVPPTSRPASYSLLAELNEKGRPKLRKIAVLMTDGEYNTEYCEGVTTSKINCNSPNGDSTYQARQLCANMKAAGITVYTVGFQLPNSGQSRETLRQCATDPTMFYTAESGEQLRQSFRDIALKISDLYLTK